MECTAGVCTHMTICAEQGSLLAVVFLTPTRSMRLHCRRSERAPLTIRPMIMISESPCSEPKRAAPVGSAAKRPCPAHTPICCAYHNDACLAAASHPVKLHQELRLEQLCRVMLPAAAARHQRVALQALPPLKCGYAHQLQKISLTTHYVSVPTRSPRTHMFVAPMTMTLL